MDTHDPDDGPHVVEVRYQDAHLLADPPRKPLSPDDFRRLRAILDLVVWETKDAVHH
jgi:hypothetical protein